MWAIVISSLATCGDAPENAACPFNYRAPISQIAPGVLRAAEGVCFDLGKIPKIWTVAPSHDRSLGRSIEARIGDVALPDALPDDLVGVSFGPWFDACQGDLRGSPDKIARSVVDGISVVVGEPLQDADKRWTFVETHLRALREGPGRAKSPPAYHDVAAGIACMGQSEETLSQLKNAPIFCSFIDKKQGWGFAYDFPARLQKSIPAVTSAVVDAIQAARVPCPSENERRPVEG